MAVDGPAPDTVSTSGDDGLAIVRALAQWTLDYKARASGLDYPFDRPYLDLYERCLTTLRATDAFLRNPPEDNKVKGALERLQRYLAPVDCDVPFRQITERLRRRAALFDELRGVLRLATAPQEDETEHDLERMQKKLNELVASLKKRRPERGPAQDIREAIDIILKHIDIHGANLWGHAIRLPESRWWWCPADTENQLSGRELFRGRSSTMSVGVAGERTSPKIWNTYRQKPLWSTT